MKRRRLDSLRKEKMKLQMNRMHAYNSTSPKKSDQNKSNEIQSVHFEAILKDEESVC
jgi:hypothetical protein